MFVTATFWTCLVAAAAVFWLLPLRVRPWWVAVSSFAWLATLDLHGALAATLGALAFFWLAPLGARPAGKGRVVVRTLILAAVVYLAVFKYLPPLLQKMWPDTGLASLVLPVGISYFTFKLIHYAVEAARGNVKDRSLGTFLSYILLAPIFTAGPIERFDHYLANREEKLTGRAVAESLTLIAHGLVKKFVLADWLVFEVLNGKRTGTMLFSDFADVSRGEARSFLVWTFLYGYLDFAGYSDLAIGTSRLFGVRIAENFDWPILARNIGSFWKKWHMTLAGWCQSYVYLPTIGLFRNPYVAVGATFLAIGLWHSGSLNYVVWGLYHATGVCVWLTWNRARLRKGKRPATSGWRSWWGIPVTFLFVTGSYLFSTTNPVAHDGGAAQQTAGIAQTVVEGAIDDRADRNATPTPLGLRAAFLLGARACGWRGER